MPTLNSPLKNKISLLAPQHILQMLGLLIQDIDSTIEIDEYDFYRSGSSYSVETIRYLQQKYPESSISMIVGSYKLMKFQQWKEYNKILDSVHIIGFNRANYDFTPIPGMNITWIEDFNMDISSVEIRKDIATGELKEHVLTSSVKKYIFENNLYRDE